MNKKNAYYWISELLKYKVVSDVIVYLGDKGCHGPYAYFNNDEHLNE